jgi:hypothetical protein
VDRDLAGRSTIAIGDAGPRVEVIDAVNKVPIGAVEVGSGTEHAAFSPDGKTLAVATSTGDLVSIDVSTRSERGRVSAEGLVDAIAFDPRDGKLLTAEHDASRREFLVPRDPVTFEPGVEGSSRRGRIGDSGHQCSARHVRHGVRAGRHARDDANQGTDPVVERTPHHGSTLRDRRASRRRQPRW